MKTQHLIPTLLLLFLSLLDNALGAVIHPDDHAVHPNRSSSYATNTVGIASVIYHSPDGQPHGQAPGVAGYLPFARSASRRAAQMNISWTPVTEIYMTTSVNVIVPVNYTQTYTVQSTELTSTTIEMGSATQTVVQIAGYSIIGTYTTTFLEPASSSTYSMIQTVTTTSSELVIPSVDTLTLTGTLPGALVSGSLVKRSPEHSLTDEVMGTAPSGTSELSKLIKSVHEQTESSSSSSASTTSSVLVFTVTNTYSVTPTSEHTHKTVSDSSDWTSWLVPAPTTSNSTAPHHQPTTTSTLVHNNTTSLTHTATMVPDVMSTSIIHVTSAVPGVEGPTETTGTASPSSTSSGSSNFRVLQRVVRNFHAALAVTLAFWYFV